jgi:RNA polymerase sigma factor (sigma-70 family)
LAAKIGAVAGLEPVRDSESTIDLLARARSGDQVALDRLFTRELRKLKPFASGRLPQWARDVVDTDDLIQEALSHALRRIQVFEYRTEGAFQAYLRTAVSNRVLNELRRAMRQPPRRALDSGVADSAPSALDALIGKESAATYERLLAQLQPAERNAVIGRVELGLDYQDLAVALDRPSADAARMAVARALLKLAKLLKNP